MANTITNTCIVKGRNLIVQQIYISSDGFEETDLVVYDSSTIATVLGKSDPYSCVLVKADIVFQGITNIASIMFEYDATTDQMALPLSLLNTGGISRQTFDFQEVGGISNLTKGTAGATGDILLTTNSLDNGNKILIFLYVRPY